MHTRLPRLNRSIRPVLGLTAALAVSQAVNDWRRRPELPDDRHSIGAVLVSCGMDDGKPASLNAALDTARWVARLDSPDCEEQVNAALLPQDGTGSRYFRLFQASAGSASRPTVTAPAPQWEKPNAPPP